jgi:hypothetical protein
MDTYKDFAARSLDFRNLWNANVMSDGFSGFLDSRYENGETGGRRVLRGSLTWGEQDRGRLAKTPRIRASARRPLVCRLGSCLAADSD